MARSQYVALLRIVASLDAPGPESLLHTQPFCGDRCRYTPFGLLVCAPALHRRVALIAAALFAFNAFDVRYSQEARSYALFLLLATLSSGFLIAFLRDSKSRYRKYYVAVSALAAYAHFYALLLVAAQWLVVWKFGVPSAGDEAGADATTRIKRELRGAWIAIFVAVLPLIAFIVKTGAGPIKWIHRPGLWGFLQFCEHMAGGNSWLLLAIC